MIVFTYKVNDFLNNAQIISMYRANALVQHGPQIDLDDTEASYEDQSILTNYLKKGAAIIAANMSGYAKALYDTDGITALNALDFIAEDLTVDPIIEAQIIFRINLPDSFNNTLILPCDEAIKDALENYMLYRLFKHKGHNFESFMDDYKSSVNNILTYINHRSTVTKRSMNLF